VFITYLTYLKHFKYVFVFNYYCLQNSKYESTFNDDDFGFESVENNSRTCSPENHNRSHEDGSKIISRHQHLVLDAEHLKETPKKKKY